MDEIIQLGIVAVMVLVGVFGAAVFIAGGYMILNDMITRIKRRS